jgi:hypothetical protein
MRYILICIGISLLLIVMVLLFSNDDRGSTQSGQQVGSDSQVNYPRSGHSKSDKPINTNSMSVDGLPRNLALDSYIQATLTDKDYSQVLTLRVISETKGDSFFQYEVQSSEGEVGIITLGIDRVFGFLPTKEGVYEYAGSSLDLQFERSVMDKFEGDLYPSTLKELR